MAFRLNGPSKNRQPCVLCDVIIEVGDGIVYTMGPGDWEVLHSKCEIKLLKLKRIMAAMLW